jgi:uncharacterized protein YjbI with pentapeptide repeats
MSKQARGVGCPYFAGRENMIKRVGFAINGLGIVLDNTTTDILAISNGYINVSSTEDYGVRYTGTQTTAIDISGTHTTGISMPSGASITTGISIAETCTDAILLSAVNTDAIHISGANTNALNISGANTTAAILISAGTAIGISISAAMADAIKLSGANTDAIELSGANTNAINISGANTTAAIVIAAGTAIGLSISAAMTDAIKISGAGTDGIDISGAQSAYGINIAGVCTTAGIMLDGTNKLMFDDSAMYMRASADGHLEIVSDDTITLSSPGHGSIVFGGETDWGTGATGHVIDGTGWDWCTQTVARVDSGALAAACAATYTALTVTPATHSTASSFFGSWTELYIQATQTLAGAANVAAVWGQVECGATVTGPDQSDGDFMAAGYFNFITGATFTTGSYVNGVRIQSEVSNSSYTLTGSTWMAAVEILTKSGSFQNWTYGIKMAGADTGIDIGACTTGIAFSSTMATGIAFSGSTLTPDANRTDIAIEVGSRATELDVAMTAAANQNLDPIQTNLNITGSNPTGSSTVNTIYQKITHDTTDMTNLRLKCADWNIAVAKNVKDVYVYQGQVDFSGTVTVNSEAAVMGLTMNFGSGTFSGTGYGIVVAMTGASMPASTSTGVFISNRAATLTRGLYIETNSTTTITDAIYIHAAGTITTMIRGHAVTNMTNLFMFDAVAGFVSTTDNVDTDGADSTGSLKIDVNGTPYYIPIFDAVV